VITFLTVQSKNCKSNEGSRKNKNFTLTNIGSTIFNLNCNQNLRKMGL